MEGLSVCVQTNTIVVRWTAGPVCCDVTSQQLALCLHIPCGFIVDQPGGVSEGVGSVSSQSDLRHTARGLVVTELHFLHGLQEVCE